MKYIIVEVDGEKVPIIFGEKLSHKGMLAGVREAQRQQVRESGRGGSWAVEPVSAAFVVGLHVDRVEGYSESMRYGHGYIEDHDLTVAHPEIDLPLINGKNNKPALVENRPPDPSVQFISHREHVTAILTKRLDSVKHLSFSKRRAQAIEYVRRNVETEGPIEKAYEYVGALCRELGFH
jgi:hypothetical protein